MAIAAAQKDIVQKIPKLRFSEFSGAWEEKRLKDVAGVNSVSENLPHVFTYIDLESVEKGTLKQHREIKKEDAPSRAQRVLQKDDILFQTVRPYQQNNLFFDFDGYYVASTGYAQIRTDQDSVFLYQYLHTSKFLNNVLSRCTGSNYPAINSSDLKKIKINLPSLPEQQKIANFLGAVDEWIENLRAQKQSFEEYKKGMMQKIFSQEVRFKKDDGGDFEEWEEKRLGDVSDITTGKLDANAMKENGQYRFYTCAKEYYQIDKYAFDTEALLVSGNGANVGYVHYYKGKFNAYQRTYVLDNFKSDIIFVKFFLDMNLSTRIAKEKKAGNTPYIVLATLKGMIINLPSLLEQQKIADFLTKLDNLIGSKQQQITQAETWKKGLMQGLFV